jgi:anthranilate/para-aminobenzoate synthase component II
MKETEIEWLTIKQVAEMVGCTVQNAHNLVRGRIEPKAKRRKIVPPVFREVKILKRGTRYNTYLVNSNEVSNYIQTKEKRHESIQ